MIRIIVSLAVLIVLSLVLVSGCGKDEVVAPAGPDDPSVVSGFFGSGDGDFLLTVDVACGVEELLYGPFLILGSNIRYDDLAGALAVDLTVFNATQETYPLPVWLTFVSLLPDEITVLNPDNGIHNPGAAIQCEFANEDLVWSPGEPSLPYTVQFGVEPGNSIGFGIRIDIGSASPNGAIGGTAWNDANTNGIRDNDEPGLAGRKILLIPGTDHTLPTVHDLLRRTETANDGAYRFDEVMPGVYSVFWMLDDCTVPTTPNVLQIVLVEENGEVMDMLVADFGMVPVDCGPPTGAIVAWGQVGDVPEPNTDFIAVAAGDYHSLGLRSDGTISAWGTFSKSDIPAPNSDFTAVDAGNHHSLGLKSDGTIVAWGINTQGVCNILEPNSDFVAVAAGHSLSLGLKSDGTIAAWGENNHGQLDVPAPNADFVGIAAGGSHGLGLKSDGSIVAWGNNGSGACDIPLPNTGFVSIVAGSAHNLGLRIDRTIAAWGENGSGQCDVPSPNADFVYIAAGYSHSLGVKSDGSIVSWGRDIGAFEGPNAGFIAATGGLRHSLGLRTDIDSD